MATTIAKLYQEKFELIGAEIEERLPAITDGLIIHYPFDGSLSHRVIIDNSDLNILSYNSHATTWSMKTHVSNGNIATGTITTNDSATQTQALTYDLVVSDMFIWAVSSGVMATLKTWAEAGAVIWATGNDTLANNLALSTGLIGTETSTHGNIYNDTRLEAYLGRNTAGIQVDNTSTDPNYYIATLYKDCIPLYYHSMSTDSEMIMGYLYLPVNSSGSLFFDEFGYICNFANNRVWLKKLLEFQLGIANNTITDSNTTKMFKGIAIEKATANMYTDFSSSYGWVNSGTRIITDNTKEVGSPYNNREPVHKMEMTSDGNVAFMPFENVSVAVSTVYSASIWVWLDVQPDETNSFYVREWYGATNRSLGNLTHEGISIVSDLPQRKWIELRKENVTTAPDSLTIRVGCVYGAKLGSKFFFSSPKLEAKMFPMKFDDGGRGAGQLSIPNPVKTGEFTINFFCKINTVVGNVQNYNTIFCMGDYYTNNSFTIMDTGSPNVGGTQKLIRKGNAGEWNWSSNSFVSPSNFRDWHMYTVVRNSTYYRIYTDGVYRGTVTHLSTTMQDLIHVGSRQSGGNIDSSDFKNLSIYNRALSDPEVKKLAKSALSIKIAKLIVPEVKEIGYKELTPLNYTSWVVGTQGSQGSFIQNGVTAENYIIEDVDPWGKRVPVWEARPEAVSGADGGWDTSTFNIDKTKMYRFSVWVKRVVLGNGHFYLGCNGYGSVDGVLHRSDGVTNNTNPYFEINGSWIEWGDLNTWYLVVGHIWPVGSGAGTKYEDSGIYICSGEQINTIECDFIWRTETTAVRHRSYLYYSTLIETRQQWVYPRVDIVDGTEPSLNELIKGHDSRSFDKAVEFSGGAATNPLKLKSDLTESIVKIKEI